MPEHCQSRKDLLISSNCLFNKTDEPQTVLQKAYESSVQTSPMPMLSYESGEIDHRKSSLHYISS